MLSPQKLEITPWAGPDAPPLIMGGTGYVFCQAAPTHRPIFWPSPGMRPEYTSSAS